MAKPLDPSALIPAGFVVDEVVIEADRWVVRAHGAAHSSNCPACGQPSTRVHSRYRRHLADLPSAGRRVHLEIVARKFRCIGINCRRRIFAERFSIGAIRSFSRRTDRLDLIIHHLGLALGGRPGANFAKRLMLPVSNDTLLRVVRRRSLPPTEPLKVVGIDDWAFRRNHRYGSIVCDLERRHIVTLLPDREVATVQAWLVSRDRGGGYGEAIANALPNAIQVADRWHLMENASRHFFAFWEALSHERWLL
jgi:transposase